jgi:predicted ATPase
MDVFVSIENFKSIQSTRLCIRKGVNILVGPNGSGKTCILSALMLLGDILRFGAARALARSGGAHRVYNRGRKYIGFTVTCEYGERTYKGRKCPFQVSWEIQVAQRGIEKVAAITHERLVLSLNQDGETCVVLDARINRREPQRGSRSVKLADMAHFRRDLFQSSYAETRRKSDMRKHIVDVIGSWIDAIKNNGDVSMLSGLSRLDYRIADLARRFLTLEEYRIVPDAARTATDQLQFARMATDGAGVGEVIYTLEKKHYHKMVEPERYYIPMEYSYHKGFPLPRLYRAGYLYARREDYWHRLSKVLAIINAELAEAVRPIEKVSAEVDPSTGRRRLVFWSTTDKFHAEEVSDGTMKWICILVSILVDDGPIYLLEEPENFLHPWMQQRLIQIMREEADRSERAFLLSSHSATILNATKPSELLIVSQSERGTHVREITNRTEIEQALAESNFGLGDLWVSGGIGGVPSNA